MLTCCGCACGHCVLPHPLLLLLLLLRCRLGCETVTCCASVQEKASACCSCGPCCQLEKQIETAMHRALQQEMPSVKLTCHAYLLLLLVRLIGSESGKQNVCRASESVICCESGGACGPCCGCGCVRPCRTLCRTWCSCKKVQQQEMHCGVSLMIGLCWWRWGITQSVGYASAAELLRRAGFPQHKATDSTSCHSPQV
jgi:hypothetical protein